MKNEIEWLRSLINLSDENGEPCFYCGSPCEEKDHFIPVSHIKELERFRELDFKVRIPKNELLPTCKECNLILRDRVFNSKKDKKSFLKKRLAKKYERLLASPDWEDVEIGKLTGNLQTYVIWREEAKKIIRRRLKW